jgi:hypothetical protein
VELKPWQQRLLFAVVVVALTVLGVYLVGPAMHHNTSSPSAGGSTPAAVPTTPAPVVTQSPVSVSTPASVNIYNWLPFTQSGLAKAAGVVTTFGDAYDTYRYTDSVNVYTARMSGLVTPTLEGLLRSNYETPGLATQRQTQRQVSVGTATIDSIRAFGQDSITFVVTINQRVLSTQGKQTNTTDFAVTVTAVGASWQVSDIELATAGNQ